MKVCKYKANQNITVSGNLILKEDIVYMEQPNGVGGFYWLKVFNEQRVEIGKIYKDEFYDTEKKFTELK